MRISLLLTVFSLTLIGGEIPKSPDSRIIVELIAETPDIVTPTGISVDSEGRVFVIENHTHFPLKDYKGPDHDRLLVFTPTTDGKHKRTVFFEDFRVGMDVLVGMDGWIYIAERSRILRIRDTDNDGKANQTEDVILLKTTGTYPHNGLSGLCWDLNGDLIFGLGENLGHPYTMTGTDSSTLDGAKGIGGGIFRCTTTGKKLQQIARGFWNPFGNCVDQWGNLFTVDNDPGHSPPCRLLHVIQGGDYGYRFKFGRTGIHPFVAWNGELSGTLPMIHGTGEGPCEVLQFDSATFPSEYRGRLLVTSWGDHRIESYELNQRGTSFGAKMTPLIQGDDSFRPVGLAAAPDGNLYLTDWNTSSYNVNSKGRLWRIRPTQNFKALAIKKPEYIQHSQKKLKALLNGKLLPDQSFEKLALNHPDPFIRHAALANIPAGSFPPTLTVKIQAHQKTNPRSTSMDTMTQRDPNILFEFLRWTARSGNQEARPLVEASLKYPNLSYKNFRAALTTLDILDGNSKPDIFNPKLALAILNNPDTPPNLRANVLRYLPADHKAINDHQLVNWIQSDHPKLQYEAIWKSRYHLNEVTRIALSLLALNPKAERTLRLEAIATLGTAESPDSDTLTKLLTLKDPAVRSEALRSLVGAHHDADTAGKVNAIKSPGARRAMGKPYSKNYPAAENTAAWLKQMDALPGKADTKAGQRIFFNRKVATCGLCHQINERGTRVGPDLTRIGHGITRERLLESILQPNKEVSPYLRLWLITLENGTTHTGIAMRRGGSGEAYLGIDGKEFRLNKSKITDKKELYTSFMPPGLAHTLTISELRNLLAFLMEKR